MVRINGGFLHLSIGNSCTSVMMIKTQATIRTSIPVESCNITVLIPRYCLTCSSFRLFRKTGQFSSLVPVKFALCGPSGVASADCSLTDEHGRLPRDLWPLMVCLQSGRRLFSPRQLCFPPYSSKAAVLRLLLLRRSKYLITTKRMEINVAL